MRGSGEMAERVMNFNWAETPLGGLDKWPVTLQSSLSICLNSNFPIALYWGKDLILIYNDAWSPIPGNKHPWALGRPARQVWPDIWSDIEPQFKKAFSGEPGGSKDALLPMQRHGYTEECYFDFTFTPVFGTDGQVDGVFNAVIETTYRVINERRTQFLQNISSRIAKAASFEELFTSAIDEIKTNPRDIPFAFFYSLSNEGKEHFIGATESTAEATLKTGWPVDELMGSAHAIRIENVADYLSEVPARAWPEAPKQALVAPLKGSDGALTGFVVFGVSPRRKLDNEYQSFFESVTGSLSTALNTITSLEEERKRAAALAEIDRAKTAFFSNISHEFRTPLTLMLGSLEELLQKDDVEVNTGTKKTLDLTHRNALRLLRLVNNLLDFSRIEAGRERARFQAVDISNLTRQLASNFSSVFENAGLSYHINIEPVSAPVFVDRLMWEKILFNLLSNAFKYTLHGSIAVSLVQSGESVILRVRDTGAGIPAAEIPKMFDRFHRVQNTSARTYEGTGIGLSLVHELVKLHSGHISVTSEVGVGTEFTVTIPLGKDHFEPDQLVTEQDDRDHLLSDAFLEEAFSLIKPAAPINGKESVPITEKLGRILIVDDNADMRSYIKALLQTRFDVVTANNGKDALAKIKETNPDLVVSDIMMPEMDGIQLMKTVKGNHETQRLPVILLSARAGEEAKIEGYEIGADDYLVKPFSAKELIARITSQIRLARTRKEVENNLRSLIMQSPIATTLLRGRSFVIEIINDMALEVLGRTYEQVINKPVAVALPEVEQQGFIKLLGQVYDSGVPFFGNEVPVELRRFGKAQTLYLNFIYTPLRDSDNRTVGIIVVGIDVSEQVYARKAVEEAKASLNNAVELGELGTWDIDLKTTYTTYSPRVAEWWGLPEEGANLREIIDCMHPEDRDRVTRAVQHAIEVSGSYQAEYRLINAVTKQERYIQASGNVSYDQNRVPVKLSGIVRDVTLQKMTEQELARQVQIRTKQLEEVNADLQRSNNELMQFAYVASHDLQEPLRKIQTFSDMAQARLSDAAYVRSHLQKIDNSAARMATLIKDVLLYSQVTREPRDQEDVDLNTILQNVKSDFELLIEQKNAVITNTTLPSVRGNRLQYFQLFSNLIGNSLKFSERAPRIQISHEVVAGDMISHPNITAGKNYHVLKFQDNGIGFDEAYAEQIFRLFNRLHSRRDYGGTGIGLALCKKIVENHNGVITASSVQGRGSTFTVYLPAGRDE